MVVKDSKRAAVYYASPWGYDGKLLGTAFDMDKIVSSISDNFDFWVVGNGYNDPVTYGDYDLGRQIIEKVRANGVKVYGYVNIGITSPNPITIEEFKRRVDLWADVNGTDVGGIVGATGIGVDGIFIDEFGMDYQVTRDRQNEAIAHIRTYGLPYIANAWNWEHVLFDNAVEFNDTSTSKYVDFVTYNPNNTPLIRDSNDMVMFEGFGVNASGIQPYSKSVTAQLEFNKANKYKKIKKFNLCVVNIDGVTNLPDYTPYGVNLPDEASLVQFISLLNLVVGGDYLCLAPGGFGSGGKYYWLDGKYPRSAWLGKEVEFYEDGKADTLKARIGDDLITLDFINGTASITTAPKRVEV